MLYSFNKIKAKCNKLFKKFSKHCEAEKSQNPVAYQVAPSTNLKYLLAETQRLQVQDVKTKQGCHLTRD